jgi:hypothetical protein
VLILPTEEIKPGMKLAAPVTHPEHPDQDLLKAGYVLEAKVVARLRDLGIPCVYVDYPGLDDLDRHLAVNLSPARQKLYSQIKIRLSPAKSEPAPPFSTPIIMPTRASWCSRCSARGNIPSILKA